MFDCWAIRSKVRTSIIDKYNHFFKLAQKPQSLKGGQKNKESPRKHQNTLRALDILFGKPTQILEQVTQSQPAKISGLKKKMQQMVLNNKQARSIFPLMHITYQDQARSKHSFLSLLEQEQSGW